jgi:PIN domain nuclease of toxin-antitoxin system
MMVGVADTHTVIWYIFSDARLSSKAKAFMETRTAGGGQIGVSSITLIEMVYLIEKGRIPVESFTRLAAAMGESGSMFTEIPLDLRIARALSRIDVAKVPDMPDRIIAAAALYLGVPLVSRDARIQASNVSTIW